MKRLRVLRRWIAYRFGIHPRNGLQNFRLFWGTEGASLWAETGMRFPVLLASTRDTPGHWLGDVSAEFYENKPSPSNPPERKTMNPRTLISLALLAALTACSGGGGSTASSGSPSGSGGTPLPITGVSILSGSPTTPGALNGMGAAALFSHPYGVAVDAAGNTYVGDWGNETIRKVTPAGVTTTLAGSAGLSGLVDGVGSAARFNHPTGVAVDTAGNCYVADLGNNAIRKVTKDGTVSTLAGGSWGNADGIGAAAKFNFPYAVALDASGNVYATDNGNCTIRKITPAGVVTTLAGTGHSGSADGVGTAAAFSWPAGIAVDAAGNMIVADLGNHTIRKITPSGTVTTLAGLAGVQGLADATGSIARFHNPWGVVVDGNGNIYVADTDNNLIRKVTPGGVVSTVAGIPGSTVVAAGALPGMVGIPYGLALAPDKSLVAATGHAILRVVLP